MKSLILAAALMTSFDASAMNCSSVTLSGGILPTRVDGNQATYAEMVAKRNETVAYIGRLERVLDECRTGNWSEAELVRSMEIAAKRFNYALRRFKTRQELVAQQQSTRVGSDS